MVVEPDLSCFSSMILKINLSKAGYQQGKPTSAIPFPFYFRDIFRESPCFPANPDPGGRFSKVPITFPARKAILRV